MIQLALLITLTTTVHSHVGTHVSEQLYCLETTLRLGHIVSVISCQYVDAELDTWSTCQ